MIIGIDFDGVLHSYDKGWTGPIPFDNPIKGAVEFVKTLVAEGHKVFVFSARLNGHTEQECVEAKLGMQAWLKHWGFPNLEVTGRKLSADLYIDDRAYRFKGDFFEPLEMIRDGDIHSWIKKEAHNYEEIVPSHPDLEKKVCFGPPNPNHSKDWYED